MKKKIKVGIASPGRFHLLDLARELAILGYDVKFYSYVPFFRARRFGLSRNTMVSLAPLALLPWLIEHKFPKPIASKLQVLAHKLLDWLTCQKLEQCDVFICMSGIYLKSMAKASHKYGAKLYVERGSRHILSQQKILAELCDERNISAQIVENELSSYNASHFVTIPSEHVYDSFLEYGFSAKRIFQNHYGVSLAQFHHNDRFKTPKQYDGIMVGAWSLRKGADILTEVVSRNPNASFLHVGPLVDYPFPTNLPNFEHRDAVHQFELLALYNLSSVLVLLSREEGLSVVMAQGLAAGLPIVCSYFSGGADLKNLVDYPEAITPVDISSSADIQRGWEKSRQLSRSLADKDLIGKKGRETLTWAAYARRYSDHIRKHLKSF